MEADKPAVSARPLCKKTMKMLESLPVYPSLPELKKALAEHGRAVLQADAGAGKTTGVPLALLDEPWLENKKIIMLEPRRLAARACAARMASMLDERVGQTTGYHIRMDKKVSSQTRIEIVTEGLFTRKIQSDPSLEEYGMVVFDEFHERSIHTDSGLALCLEAAEAFRNDLKILVMSATMETGPVSNLLTDAPVIKSKGKAFPVTTKYMPPPPSDRRPDANERHVSNAVEKALTNHEGDMLVFLPGYREIRRLHQRLMSRVPDGTLVLPLFGSLSRVEQDKAIKPSASGKQKVVLATSIAETSLTIEGITVVIDSGWMRVPVFSSRTGMTRLETVPASRAASDQRRGRAGRLAPGTCYRLWSSHEQKGRVACSQPEILSADLADLVLELALWGVVDPGVLKWLDPPPDAAFKAATTLLKFMEVIDKIGHITAHGKQIASYGMHPRLAHMISKSMKIGQGRLACRLAALLQENGSFQAVPASALYTRRRVKFCRHRSWRLKSRKCSVWKKHRSSKKQGFQSHCTCFHLPAGRCRSPVILKVSGLTHTQKSKRILWDGIPSISGRPIR